MSPTTIDDSTGTHLAAMSVAEAAQELAKLIAPGLRRSWRWNTGTRRWLARIDGADQWQSGDGIRAVTEGLEILEQPVTMIRPRTGTRKDLRRECGTASFLQRVEKSLRAELEISPDRVHPYVHPRGIGLDEVRCPTCNVLTGPCKTKRTHGRREWFHHILNGRMVAGLYTRRSDGEFEILADYFPSGTRTGTLADVPFLAPYWCPFCGAGTGHNHVLPHGAAEVRVTAACGLGTYTLRPGRNEDDYKSSHPIALAWSEDARESAGLDWFVLDYP